jgi:hypothetical protein
MQHHQNIGVCGQENRFGSVSYGGFVVMEAVEDLNPKRAFSFEFEFRDKKVFQYYLE